MAQPFLNRRKVFLGAIQTGETIEILDATDGGLLIKEAATSSLVLVNNDRSDVARDTLSNLSNVMGSKAAEISVEGELIPSGDVGVAPSVDTILRVCGMEKNTIQSIAIGAVTGGPFQRGEVVSNGSGASGIALQHTADGDDVILLRVVAGTFTTGNTLTGATSGAEATASAGPVAGGFEYKPRSKGMEWGTFSLWEDDYQKTIHSAMGTISFNFEASLIGSFSATLTGPITYDETTDQWGDGSMPNPTFSCELPAVLHDAKLRVSDVDGTNAVTTLVGQTVVIDAGNEVALRRDMNDATGLKGAHIPKRVPTATIGVEYLTDSQYPIYEKLFNNDDSEISFRLGDGTAGRTIEFYGKVNYNEVGVGDENGLATEEISCSLVDNCNSGDTEYSILFI